MSSDSKVSLVIPAFNEAERIGRVIEPATSAACIDSIIVVDDGSTDDTLEAAFEFIGHPGLALIRHNTNRGKGEALDSGVKYARQHGSNKVVFLDGDLHGVEPDHIESLVAPLDDPEVYMTIGYLGLRKAVVKKAILNRWGALSGQRALRTEVWELLSGQDKHGFNVEAALNARLRQQNLHRTINRVALEGVGHVGKHDKEGTWPKALWAYSKTYSAAMWTYTRIDLEKTNPDDRM